MFQNPWKIHRKKNHPISHSARTRRAAPIPWWRWTSARPSCGALERWEQAAVFSKTKNAGKRGENVGKSEKNMEKTWGSKGKTLGNIGKPLDNRGWTKQHADFDVFSSSYKMELTTENIGSSQNTEKRWIWSMDNQPGLLSCLMNFADGFG